MDFLSLWYSLSGAEFTVTDILVGITTLFTYVFADANIIMVNEYLYSLVEVAVPYLPIGYIVLALILAFFGKRIYALPRFLAFFFVGFLLGTYFLAPIISPIIPQLPAWVIGVVIATIVSVLSKFLYYVIYTVAVAYPVYSLSFSLIPLDGLTIEGKCWIAFGISVVVTVIALLLRKFIEMAGTAALGGYIVAESIRFYFDYTTLDFLSGIEWVGILVITLVIALIGFIVQVKTRERY